MPLSPETRRKWLAYAAALFASGALCGTFFGWGEAHRRRPSPRPMGPPPSGQHLCDHLRSGLTTEFGLSEEQLRTIDPILQRRAQELDRILLRSRTEIEALSTNSDNELAAALHLTPDQRARLPFLGRGGPRNGPRGGLGGDRPFRPDRFERERREHESRGDGPEHSRPPEDRRPPRP